MSLEKHYGVITDVKESRQNRDYDIFIMQRRKFMRQHEKFVKEQAEQKMIDDMEENAKLPIEDNDIYMFQNNG